MKTKEHEVIKYDRVVFDTEAEKDFRIFETRCRKENPIVIPENMQAQSLVTKSPNTQDQGISRRSCVAQEI